MTLTLLPAIREFLAINDASRDDVRALVINVALWFGLGFHPDTPGEDYVHVDTGEPTFTPEDAAVFERARLLMFKFDDIDPSEVAMSAAFPDGPAGYFKRHMLGRSQV